MEPDSVEVVNAQEFNRTRITENGSYAFSTTESKCLDFFFDVMQCTDENTIRIRLSESWDVDALLTLKLVFHLRDIRHGKGAIKEFHECLLWLFDHHPQTLIYNLQFVAQHGYWKDLSYLIKYILNRHIPKTTSTQQRHQAADTPIDTNEPAEEIIRRRVNGQISRKAWTTYIGQIPSDEARKEFKAKFQSLAKQIHQEAKNQAKSARKLAKVDAATRITNARANLPNFVEVYDTIVNLFISALKNDKELLSKEKCLPVSALVGKWSPTIGCSIDTTTELGKNIAITLYPKTDQDKKEGDGCEREYRLRAYLNYNKEYLVPLRKSINIPERLMSRKRWSEIVYDRVPSVSMVRNKRVFVKRDANRFKNYLEQVKGGTKKIASGALMPHEIISQFLSDIAESHQVAELQWISYVDKLRQSGLFASALSVCDVSGSMEGLPMAAAIALSLLTAALSRPPFNDIICTFSASPQLQFVNQPTLKEKIEFTKQMEWGSNTNLQAVFDMILKLAQTTQLPPDDMVKTIFIFSDMEFDDCGGAEYETNHQLAKRQFEEAGYQLPCVVFWNLRGGNRSKPVVVNEQNVALVSGFSGQMMTSLLKRGTIPNSADIMYDSLSNHYDHLKIID